MCGITERAMAGGRFQISSSCGDNNSPSCTYIGNDNTHSQYHSTDKLANLQQRFIHPSSLFLLQQRHTSIQATETPHTQNINPHSSSYNTTLSQPTFLPVIVHQPRTQPLHTYKETMSLESAFPIKHILDTPILPISNLQCLLKPFIP